MTQASPNDGDTQEIQLHWPWPEFRATMRSMFHFAQMRRFWVVAGGLTMLLGCAQLHESVAALTWKDQWGNRGPQVLARDYRMCERLVEQRRSLLATCLASRGWTL